MKRVGAVVLVALLLVPLLAVPATAGGGFRHHGRHFGHHHHGGAGFVIGLGLGALLTAPFWYRPAYAYPVYAPAYTPVYAPAYTYPVYAPAYGATPAYTPPAYLTPTPQPVSPAPQGGGEAVPPAPEPGSATPPASPGPPQTSAQTCETVWVEGHYETRVLQSGQRYTAWVPAHRQQLCR